MSANFVIFVRFVFFVITTDSVRLRSFVPPVTPLPPSPPLSPGAQHPANQPGDDEQQKDNENGAADHVS